MNEIELKKRAKRLWPHSESLQKKWIAAAQYLLTRKRWVLYGGAVTWRAVP